MKRNLLLSVALLLTTTSFAASEFLGTYHCTGFDPYLNQNYSGTIVVEQQNAVYKITMKYDTGQIYKATGGQYNERLLSVVFQDEKDLKVVGLEQYHWIKDKKEMGGFWVYLGKDQLGKEICVRDAPAEEKAAKS